MCGLHASGIRVNLLSWWLMKTAKTMTTTKKLTLLKRDREREVLQERKLNKLVQEQEQALGQEGEEQEVAEVRQEQERALEQEGEEQEVAEVLQEQERALEQ